MDAPSAAGAGDESRALSDREQVILASIERQLASTDPAFAKIMSGNGSTRCSPFLARRTSLVVAAMLITTVTAVLVPVSWWAGLALLATTVVLPAALLWAVERQGFD